jgi:hypothetical protein
MTAPMRHTPYSTALPASQTAPVNEFRCLFTTDVKRKQKRWQDGYLKFHTFNNRVMVSDQARNHIGDTYWKESNELQEGDELSLDKGVLVEVAEAMGITQTELAPLLAKKKDPPREPPRRPTPSANTRPFQRPTSVAPSSVVRANPQLKHKSLNTLLGTPKGPVGKAVPLKSPYQVRMEKEQENEFPEERAPKRQKTIQRPTVWRASSPVNEDEPSPAKPMPLWARTADAKSAPTPQPAVRRSAKVITISSESDHISDITLSSTPARAVKSVPATPIITLPDIRSSVFEEPVTIPIETPRPPPARIRLPKRKSVETSNRPAPTSSPPVSASNRLTNVDFAVQTVQKPQKKQSPPPPPSPPRNTKAKSLRLSVGVKRGTLLCQTLARPASRAGSEPRASAPRASNPRISRIQSKEPSSAIPEEHSEEQRARDLSAARTTNVSKEKSKEPAKGTKAASRKAKSPTPSIELEEDLFDDPEVIHGLMDQQLLAPSSPEEPLQPRPSSPRRPAAPRKSAKKPTKETPIVEKTPDAEDTPLASRPSASRNTTKKAQSAKKPAEMSQAKRPVSPPAQSVFKPPDQPSRDISPVYTDASAPASRTNSTSPTKPAFSTGGFPKKTKRFAKKNTAPAPPSELPTPAPLPPSEPAALPPHPLTKARKGPLMSTTELAALLTKPKKRPRHDDPIEDDAPAGKSPARKIRRVRSENDAPIPSTAEDWEKRNLPKTSSTLTEIEETVADPPAPVVKRKESGLAALVKRTDPRKKFARTVSLNVETNLVPTDVEPDLPSPVIDGDVGPWSTEAFDLFDWRPPGRERKVED